MLYVPIMVLIATSMKRLEIIPVSLFLSFMTQVPAAYTHYKKDFVEFKLGLFFALATLPGVVFGVLLGLRAADVLAYCLFAILMFITGIKMLIDLYNKKFDREDTTKVGFKYSTQKVASVFLISICTGVVSSFFGVGGGIITVPVLIYILDMYPRRAIGTSAFMIVNTSIVGFLCYFLLSLQSSQGSSLILRTVPAIQFELALILGIVVLIGAYLGSSWGLKSLKTKSVQMIFIAIIFFVGVELLLKSLGYF